MNKFEPSLKQSIQEALSALFGIKVLPGDIVFQETRKEFEGDFTLVVFPFARQAAKSPEATGNEIGAFLKANSSLVSGFNVVKGFLNISIADAHWLSFFNEIALHPDRLALAAADNSSPATLMVEYSSPNTNKPLHLGHVR